MKKIIFLFLVVSVFSSKLVIAQNLIANPNFEEIVNVGCNDGISRFLINDSFNLPTNPFNCYIKDWMAISQTPDAWCRCVHQVPINTVSKSFYPHSDSISAGIGLLQTSINNSREILEGKLIMPLITNHIYKFSMYVQLFNVLPNGWGGKIVASNSFSAYFSNTLVKSVGPFNNLPIQNYSPQVQIWQMVTDTQHWVLLQDTFIATGGEQYVSIGNFKTNAQTKTFLIDSISNGGEVAYYFIDDVSLIDITPNGVDEVGVRKLEVYPNPASQSIVISYQSPDSNWEVNTVEITDVLGRTQMVRQAHHDGVGGHADEGSISIDVSALPSGIYFIKAIDIKGNVMNGKFVKE
jgi:OmpA-OmpF porin, OOP family